MISQRLDLPIGCQADSPLRVALAKFDHKVVGAVRQNATEGYGFEFTQFADGLLVMRQLPAGGLSKRRSHSIIGGRASGNLGDDPA